MQTRVYNNKFRWTAINLKESDLKEGKSKGKDIQFVSLSDFGKRIVMDADSGATDHVVDTCLIMTDFNIVENGIIKCANKNELANIVIDGRGSLLLHSETSGEE